MEAKEAFSKILDSDETIIEAFKPNKFRSTVIGIIGDVLVALFTAALGIVLLTIRLHGNGNEVTGAVVFFTMGGLILIYSLISRPVRYMKAWYCYTNKRIIIRSGFIGVDYKTLDYSGISAIDVRVDFLDKLVKPNTGKVLFGSASAPLITTNNGNNRGNNRGYIFDYINDPYEVYKRIKEYVGKAK